jgi:hypothetical protein
MEETNKFGLRIEAEGRKSHKGARFLTFATEEERRKALEAYQLQGVEANRMNYYTVKGV